MGRSAHVVITLLACLSACARPDRTHPQPTDPRPIFQAFVRAWNQHDYAALDTLVASDAIEEDLALGFQGEGPHAFMEFMRHTHAMIPDFNWKPTNVVASGSRLAAEWTLTGTYTGDTPSGRVKGKRFSIRGVSVMIVGGGRIKRFSDYYNLSDFYKQVTPATTKKQRSS
jgi:steroid delta-isomerase-like uncharacterized protein